MRIIIYTGKGGTGKSTIACMTALRAAELGYKTLLVSSDPSHTIADALGTPISFEETKVGENLWAIHLDPIREAAKHYSEVIEYLVKLLSSRGLDETLAYEVASLPGMTGVASLLRIEGYWRRSQYDVIIADTVPSGEALKILFLPTIFGKLSRKIVNMLAPLLRLGKVAEPIIGLPSPDSNMVKKEVKVLEQMDNLRRILTDFDSTSVRLIVNPDAFNVEHVKRTYMLLSLYGLNVDLAVINKVIPGEEASSYFDEWIKSQKRYINELRFILSPLPIKFLKLYRRELVGMGFLSKVSRELFPEDPTKVFHRGKPITVNKVSDGVEIVLNMPYVSRKEVEIERIGDELTIHFKTSSGEFQTVIPLPTITYRLKLRKAKLINDSLHLLFSEG